MSSLFHASHSKIGRSTHAAGTAGAHVDYVCRSSACSAVVAEGMPAPKPGDRKRRNRASRWINRREAKMRRNGRVADKINLALPYEIPAHQRLLIVGAFMEELAGDQEPPPWLAALHDQGEDASNPHIHLVIHDHRDGKRVIGMSKKGSTERIREAWEKVANQFLEAAGSDVKIDRRSLAEQGIDRVPQKHIGPQARAIQKKHEADPEKYLPSWKVAAVDDETAEAEARRAAEEARIVEVQQMRVRERAVRREIAMQERDEDAELAQWQREAREIEAQKAADQGLAWFQHIKPDLPSTDKAEAWEAAEAEREREADKLDRMINHWSWKRWWESQTTALDADDANWQQTGVEVAEWDNFITGIRQFGARVVRAWRQAAQNAAEKANSLDIIAPSRSRRGQRPPQRALWRDHDWPDDLPEAYLDQAEARLRKMPLRSLNALVRPSEAGIEVPIDQYAGEFVIDVEKALDDPPEIAGPLDRLERWQRSGEIEAGPVLSRIIRAIEAVARWLQSTAERTPKPESNQTPETKAQALTEIEPAKDQRQDEAEPDQDDDPAPPSSSGPSL